MCRRSTETSRYLVRRKCPFTLFGLILHNEGKGDAAERPYRDLARGLQEGESVLRYGFERSYGV